MHENKEKQQQKYILKITFVQDATQYCHGMNIKDYFLLRQGYIYIYLAAGYKISILCVLTKHTL